MFDISFENDIKYGNVLITKENNKITFSIDNMFYLHDDIQYINNFCKGLNDLEYNSVLILGLGLGILPYYMENFKQISDIDVVEINKNVIDATSSLNHLKSTNIIRANANFYRTNKKYDLIIVDLWWSIPIEWVKMFFPKKMLTNDDCINILSNLFFKQFSKNLNNNGNIYIPLFDKLFNLEN